jgi:amino acid transporter
VFVLVAPVRVYTFLGFELPSAAGEELRDPAGDVPASIVRAGALTCALYAAPVLAIVLVVPADRLTGLTGFIDALATVFTVYGEWAGPVGGLAALAFLWIPVANGLTWVMASSRTQAAASLDGIGPPALGRVWARAGTPLPATPAAGVVTTGTTLAAFAVAGDDNSRSFSAALALATGWSALALAAALWPGLGTGDPDVLLPDGFAGDRLGFTLAELVPLAAVLVAPWLLVRRGRAG